MADDDRLEAVIQGMEALTGDLKQGIIAAQMYGMSAQFIMRELMVDVARMHPDPQQYLSELYDRAVKHVDDLMPKGPSEREKDALWQTRDTLGSLFREAVKALQKPQPPSPRRRGSRKE